MCILNVVGIPDDDTLIVAYNDGKLRQANYYFPGCASFLERSSKFKVETLVLGGISQNSKLMLPRFDLIVNSICNPDIHNKSLDLLERFLTLAKTKVLNRPDAVRKSARDRLYELLASEKDLVVPKTIAVYPTSRRMLMEQIEEFEYPVIVRSAKEHGGRDMVLLRSSADEELLDRFCLDGRKYYLSQFIDFRSEDGLYRKQRFIVIGDTIVPRHHIVSKHWNIHAKARAELMDQSIFAKEEREFIFEWGPTMAKKLGGFKKIGLDIFGVDCHLLADGRVLVFEANACIRIAHKEHGNYLDVQVRKIERLLQEFVKNAAKKL